MSDSELEEQHSTSGNDLHNPDWKQPFIDKANKLKEEKKALAKAEAKKKAQEIEKE